MIKSNLKPILVTGVPRSGTTWLGKMICLSKYVKYVPEFVNPDNGLFRIDKPFKWYQYINEGNYSEFESIFNNLLSFNFKSQYQINILNRFIEYITTYSGYLSNKLFGIPKALLKEPLLVFSSEFLHKKLDLNTIIIVRHPAAVVTSFKRVDWKIDFTSILNQQNLMENHLFKYSKLICEANKADIVTKVSTLWLIIMDVLSAVNKRNHEMIFVSHENLSLNPVNEFDTLFNKLGIPFTKYIEKKIIKHTTGDKIAPEKNVVFDNIRNSQKLVNYWKSQLSKEEILKIRNIVEPISKKYYDNSDWI